MLRDGAAGRRWMSLYALCGSSPAWTILHHIFLSNLFGMPTRLGRQKKMQLKTPDAIEGP